VAAIRLVMSRRSPQLSVRLVVWVSGFRVPRHGSGQWACWRTERGVGGLAELVSREGILICRKSKKGVEVKRFGSLVVVTSVVAACVVGLAGVTGASAASTLPTLNLALTRTTGITVSGSEVSGAVNVTSSFSGKGQAASCA
jgi:hypothetical protein